MALATGANVKSVAFKHTLNVGRLRNLVLAALRGGLQ